MVLTQKLFSIHKNIKENKTTNAHIILNPLPPTENIKLNNSQSFFQKLFLIEFEN